MSAISLLTEARNNGIVLSVRGDRLHVEAKPGTLSADLKSRLAASKPALIELLAVERIRAYLLALAESEGVDPAHVNNLDHADLLAYAEVPDFTEANYRAHVRAMATRPISKVEEKRP